MSHFSSKRKVYVNVARLVIQPVVPSVRLYVGVCRVSLTFSGEGFEHRKKLRTTSKTPFGHRLVSGPFQLAAIELVEYETYQKLFPLLNVLS